MHWFIYFQHSPLQAEISFRLKYGRYLAEGVVIRGKINIEMNQTRHVA